MPDRPMQYEVVAPRLLHWPRGTVLNQAVFGNAGAIVALIAQGYIRPASAYAPGRYERGDSSSSSAPPACCAESGFASLPTIRPFLERVR
jgi:hypothetical protein